MRGQESYDTFQKIEKKERQKERRGKNEESEKKNEGKRERRTEEEGEGQETNSRRNSIDRPIVKVRGEKFDWEWFIHVQGRGDSLTPQEFIVI